MKFLKKLCCIQVVSLVVVYGGRILGIKENKIEWKYKMILYVLLKRNIYKYYHTYYANLLK